METWGELFWDAWIRLRLWCRSLYRTYWPPQIKAWQICTVTGIVSVILTLVALSYQPAAKTLAEGKTDAGTEQPLKPNVAKASAKLAASADPFAADAPPVQDVVDDKTLAGVDDISPDGVQVTEHPDPGFEIAGGRRFNKNKNKPSGEEIAAAETPDPQLSTDLTPAPATEEVVPEAPSDSQLTLPPVPETTPTPAEPQAETPSGDLFEEPVTSKTPAPAASENEPFTEPAAKPTADEPEPIEHNPLATKIRSQSSYSRLGSHEDSEEDRHSVRDIRPTRTRGVPIPGGHGQSVAKQPTLATETPGETEVPVTEADTTPAVPAQENPADNLTLPPTESTPTEAVPVESVPQQAPTTEPIVEDPASAEPPPVLIAPESSVEQPASKPREYHGPVLSTDGVDHEAHQEEDVFSRTKRKTPLITDPLPAPLPQAAKPLVVSKDGVDHKAHQEEDVFSKTNRKTPLLSEPPAAQPTPPAVPALVEGRKPVVPAPEPEAAPQPSRRTAPREIHDEEEGHPATDVVVPNNRVVPTAEPIVTRPRGPSPERITVPDRMPPVDSPAPTEPSAPRDSAFAVPPTTQSVRPETAARLVMEITGPKQAPVGTQVVWHFKIQNLGSVPATKIVVSDVLPPGLQHRLSPDLEYTIDRLEPGESRETNLTVQCVAPGIITNRAVLRADGDLSTEAEIQIEVAGSSSNSSPSKFVPVTKSPLTLAHHGPERWLIDSTGQFLVTVTNTSGERLKNVTISQSYPKSTNLVHATLGSKVDQANRTVTWTIADFPPGASYILETELHCIGGGPGTSSVSVKIADKLVAEDRWTAISFIADGRP